MIWTQLAIRDVETWVAEPQSRPPAPNYRLAGLDEVHERLDHIHQARNVRIREPSCTMEIRRRRSPKDDEPQATVSLAYELGTWMDGRELRPSVGPPLRKGAKAPPPEIPNVGRADLWSWETSIDTIPCVGPGGRVTVYSLPGMTLADITTRYRTARIESRWRSPRDIATEIDGITRGEFFEVRVLGTFGYYEASKYEGQRYLRTAFVFVVDRPSVATEGPRWRVSFAVSATESDDIPPDEGLGSASGNCL